MIFNSQHFISSLMMLTTADRFKNVMAGHILILSLIIDFNLEVVILMSLGRQSLSFIIPKLIIIASRRYLDFSPAEAEFAQANHVLK